MLFFCVAGQNRSAALAVAVQILGGKKLEEILTVCAWCSDSLHPCTLKMTQTGPLCVGPPCCTVEEGQMKACQMMRHECAHMTCKRSMAHRPFTPHNPISPQT